MYWWNSDTIILWMWSSPFSVKMVMTNRVIFTSHRGSRGTNKVACFRSSVALHKLNSSSPYVHSLCCSLERVGASTEVSWAKRQVRLSMRGREGGEVVTITLVPSLFTCAVRPTLLLSPTLSVLAQYCCDWAKYALLLLLYCAAVALLSPIATAACSVCCSWAAESSWCCAFLSCSFYGRLLRAEHVEELEPPSSPKTSTLTSE